MIIFSPQYGLQDDSHAGGEFYDFMTLTGLAERGHKIVILVPYKNKLKYRHENLFVHKLPIPLIHVSYLYNIWVFIYAIILHRKYNFDLIRVHSPYYTGLGALLYKKLCNRAMKVVATYHHLEKRFVWNVIDSLAMSSWDKIVTGSEYTKNNLINSFHCEAGDIEVIYHGIIHYPDLNMKDLLQRQNIAVFCGRLIPRKNVLFLVDVVRKMNDLITLYIIGGGPDREKIEDEIVRSKLSDKIILCGGLSEEEKNNIYDKSKFFLFPSLDEGFGLAPIEAMERGLAVVSSNLGALQEVVGSGGVCLPLDSDTWSKKIKYLIDTPTKLEEMSLLSKERASFFTWSKSVETFEKVLLMTR
ncbi:MAG: glycosyltransferase family 4 protein [Candidatus Paceibacterota bacterium]|jgi:glycosyltransferase involved in cell wall biosynthesis